MLPETEEKAKRALALRKQGLSLPEIGQILGVGPGRSCQLVTAGLLIENGGCPIETEAAQRTLSKVARRRSRAQSVMLRALPVHAYILAEELPFWVLPQRTSALANSQAWKIVRLGDEVLLKTGGWITEPLPSSRTDQFYELSRFASAAEALDFWKGYNQRVPERAPGSGDTVVMSTGGRNNDE